MGFLQTFLREGLIAGLIVGFFMALIESKYVNLAGFIYGAIPYTFIYITFILWLKKKDEQIKSLTYFSLIGGFYFVIAMAIFYFMFNYCGHHYIFCIIVSNILFVLFIIFIDIFLYKFFRYSVIKKINVKLNG